MGQPEPNRDAHGPPGGSTPGDAASAGAPAPQASAPPTGEEPRTAADRVLLVEDSALDARLVESFLRRAEAGPYDVHRVRTMGEARNALHHEAFAVVLLDLNLPDARGLEALEGIRQASGGVPVVVLTGSDDRLGLAAVRAGADDFLLKGRLSPPLLGRVVRYAIERAEYRRRSTHAGRLIAAGRLAATVAHELNNPAAFVVLNQDSQATLLSEVRDALGDRPELRARVERALDLLEDNRVGMERIQSIVKSLKGFTQPSRGAIARVDLPEVVREACRLVENEIRYLTRLELDLQDVPAIAGDRTRLAQLVTNLVTNAAHAIDADAEGEQFVKVAVRAAGEEVALLVEDTGRGIPDHLRERIFEPFFTTRERAGGTGLGLALTAEIVRQHRGLIRHWDRVPRGTVMEVRLPKATGLVPEAEASAGPGAATDQVRARILLIDDEVRLLRAVKRALHPHDVVTAPGGRDAVELLQTDRRFDVVFCDLMMPEVDGAAVYAHVAEHAPELVPRLVFVSGGAFTAKVQRFLAQVGRPVVDKPVDITELRAVVTRTLRANAPPEGGAPPPGDAAADAFRS